MERTFGDNGRMPSAFRCCILSVVLAAGSSLPACGSEEASNASGESAGGGHGGAGGAPGVGGSDAGVESTPDRGLGETDARDADLSGGDSSGGIRAVTFVKNRLNA